MGGGGGEECGGGCSAAELGKSGGCEGGIGPSVAIASLGNPVTSCFRPYDIASSILEL